MTVRAEQRSSRPTYSACVGGALTALVGAAEVIAWRLHLGGVLRLRPGYTAMAFNTAVGLVVVGLSIVLGSLGRIKPLRVAGAVAVALGTANMIESGLDLDLRIDQLLMRDYMLSDPLPGRLAANTAFCFLVSGTALLLWQPRSRTWRSKVLVAASLVVAVLAVAAIVGYLARLPLGYRWSNNLSMALPTAFSMCVLAASLMALGYPRVRIGSTARDPFPAWVAVPVGLAAFAISGLLWQVFVIIRPAETMVSASTVSRAALMLSVVAAAMAALIASSTQRAVVGRHEAVILATHLRAEVARRTEAEIVARDSERLLLRFMEALPMGIAIARPDGQPHYVKDLPTSRVPGAAGHHPGADSPDGPYVAGSDREYPSELLPMTRGLAGLTTHIDDVEMRGASGLMRHEVWGIPVLDDDGRVQFGITVSLDISERRAAEREIREKSTLLELSRDAIFMRDPTGLITYWNHGAELQYGWTREEAIGQNAFELLAAELPAPRSDVEDELRRTCHWHGEVIHHTRAGQPVAAMSHWVAQLNPAGDVAAVMAINTDITALKAVENELQSRTLELEWLNLDLERSNQKLEQSNLDLEQSRDRLAHLALHDPLTGLANRDLLLDRTEQALARSHRAGEQVTLLFIDLDRFKVVNDTRGHAIGDDLLRHAARRLESVIRDSDTAARIGGDEFVLLCEGVSPEQTRGLSARVVEAFRKPFDVADGAILVTASVGVAIAGPGAKAAKLLRDADTAMYKAKRAGRNSTATCDT